MNTKTLVSVDGATVSFASVDLLLPVDTQSRSAVTPWSAKQRRHSSVVSHFRFHREQCVTASLSFVFGLSERRSMVLSTLTLEL